MNTRKQSFTLECSLLGFVRERPEHGYEIYQQLLACQQQGLVWRVKQGMMYAMLSRLEAESLLASAVETQGVRPPRRLLFITASGEIAWREWISSPVRHGRDFRLAFLTKLFFAQRDGPATALALVRRQYAATLEQSLQLQTQREEQETRDDFSALVVDFRVGQMGAILEWLKRSEQVLGLAHDSEPEIVRARGICAIA